MQVIQNQSKNSLIGPPRSTAPSLIPLSSVNFTDTLFAGEKDLRDNARLVPSHKKVREMLNFDMLVSSISFAKSVTISSMSFSSALAKEG